MVRKDCKSRGTIFGLFDDLENLVGITAIIIEEEGHGYLTHSYLIPEARGRGLSKIFFETRIRWARDRKLKRLIVNHRRSNFASKAAIQKFGFRFLYSEAVLWPDGNTDELLHYELIL